MRPVVKRWVEALRSGEYEQGKHFLEKDGKFCCLGVLCKIEGHYYEEGKSQILPEALRYKIGIKSSIGEYSLPNEEFNSLTELNDNGYDFESIANFIEKNEDELFREGEGYD